MFKQNKLTLFIIIITLFISCATNSNSTDTALMPSWNHDDPYPGMEILRYPNSQAYLFPSVASDKLIIVIEGAGWNSVLGVKENNTWLWGGMAVALLQELRDAYTFLVPEKLKRQPGLDYENDMEDRANYTAKNLVACYTDSINGYLAGHDFSSIVLIGGSEGALLLPLVYEKINKKDRVVAMVSMSYGGLSMYEQTEILYNARSGYPAEFIEAFTDVLETFNPEKTEFPDSFEEDYYGLTYKYLNSVLHIKPLDYYKNIDTPILFIHGIYDFIIPFESTFYIQDNLPDKPFEYRYFQWAHQPDSLNEIIHFRKMIAKWVLSHS